MPNAPQTDLTKALDVARADEKQANYFYDAFLNWDLCLPVRLEGDVEPSWRSLDIEDKFYPLFISDDDMRVVPVFDSIVRLREWAAPQTLDYLEIRGHLLVRMLGGQVALALNPGSPWNFLFTPEILKRLEGAMRPITPA